MSARNSRRKSPAREVEASAAVPLERFDPQIETEIAGIRFPNPVWTASGTFGYGKEFSTLIDLNE